MCGIPYGHMQPNKTKTKKTNKNKKQKTKKKKKYARTGSSYIHIIRGFDRTFADRTHNPKKIAKTILTEILSVF